MQAGKVYPIPNNLKNQNKELEKYDYMQCVGSNFEFTLLVSMLDCFLANENINKIQMLVTPQRTYTYSSQQIVQKIQNFIIKERNLLTFYQSVQNSDPQFKKANQFLDEFCNNYEQPQSQQLKQKIIILTKIFQVSFYIFGQLIRKVENSNTWILIYQNQKQLYYYVKQFYEDFKPKIHTIHFQKLKQSDVLYENYQTSQNNNIDYKNSTYQIVKKRVIEESKDDERQITESQQDLSKRTFQKQIFGDQIENQQYKDDPKNSIQFCMNCYDRPQTPLFINKNCGHSFCAKCIENITNLEKCYFQCLKQNCTQLIDSISAFYYCQNISTFRKEKIIQLEFKKCNGCGITNILKSKQFQNDCQHTFCIDCSIIFTKQSCQDKIPCSYFGCPYNINYQNLNKYLKQQQIKFECSKCQLEIYRENLYLNETCAHYLCIPCLDELILKNKNNNTIQYLCPVHECDKVLNQPKFSQFLCENQSKLLNNSSNIQFQLQEQQDIYQVNQIQPTFQIKKYYNDDKNMGIMMNYQEEKQIQNQNQCSLCFKDFSSNQQLKKLDCLIHQIGDCCFSKYQQ
ncbi:unnamed protein product [Paramecium pentaurelia]|uniref:RING-type domain-containing protein n=1 Tax=Paramecium pentaurelia TaxID=43138 RepID=A0A8S1WEG7_9CILI|nr:unnamed protein product [Paramecium pentaurelia]